MSWSKSLLRAVNRMAGLLLAAVPAICVGQSIQLSQTLAPSAAEAPDGPPLILDFGASIAPDGRTLMIGMPGYRNNTGRVAVFTRAGSGAWARAGSIDAPAHMPGQLYFGQNIALRHDVALISTAFGTPDLYLYRLNHGHWTELARLSGRGGASMTFVDHEVFIGNTIYRLDSKAGRLVAVQTLTVGNTDGQSPTVAVSRDTAVLGFADDDEARGTVYVFRRHGDRWYQHQVITAIDGQPGDGFGSALSIRGRVLAVGAPGRPNQDPACGGTRAGLAYVFKERAGIWVEHQTVEPPEQCAVEFGSTVAINQYALSVGDQPVQPAHYAQAYLYREMGGQYVFASSASGLESGAPDLFATKETLYVGFPREGLGIGGGVQFSPGEVQVFNVSPGRSD